MSAMNTPEFVFFVNDVLCFPFLVTFTMAMCALVLVFLVLVRGMWCKHHLSLGEMVNPVLDGAGEWVSRVFKDQVYGVFKMFSLGWLFGWWTAAFVCDMLSFFSNFLYVVVLLHFEKAELASEGIRHFVESGEIEEVKLNTCCDLHETPRCGSSGFPVCSPRFGMRFHARCLGMDAQGTLEFWSESNLAKETGVCERTQVDGQFRKVQAGVLVLLVLRLGDLAHVVSSCLLVTVWLESTIAFFPEFPNSQSESNLVKNLESVNARKWMVEFEKFLFVILLVRQP